MSYDVAVVCKNCGWDGLIEISDGELVESQTCPTCKCQRITKQYGIAATRHIPKPE